MLYLLLLLLLLPLLSVVVVMLFLLFPQNETDNGHSPEVILIAYCHGWECDALVVVDFDINSDWSGEIIQDTL